jgi:hypothetical protein
VDLPARVPNGPLRSAGDRPELDHESSNLAATTVASSCLFP